MNYAWEIALRADGQEISRDSLQFWKADNPSPYIEASFENLNESTVSTVVEINPLYRFADIFSKVFDCNVKGLETIREMLLDITIHYFIQLDLREGMSRREYYLRFLLQDILAGYLGEESGDIISWFSQKQVRWILSAYLNIWDTANYLETFKQLMKKLYPHSLVYLNNDIANEILIYVGREKTNQECRKLQFVIDTFLPVNMVYHLFWQNHFGIIDVEETMKIDEMVLF